MPGQLNEKQESQIHVNVAIKVVRHILLSTSPCSHCCLHCQNMFPWWTWPFFELLFDSVQLVFKVISVGQNFLYIYIFFNNFFSTQYSRQLSTTWPHSRISKSTWTSSVHNILVIRSTAVNPNYYLGSYFQFSLTCLFP